MALPCLKNARRIFAIVSTTSIPTSAPKNHGSQCGPSVPGSRLEADHPEKGVLFACRFTAIVLRIWPGDADGERRPLVIQGKSLRHVLRVAAVRKGGHVFRPAGADHDRRAIAPVDGAG